MERVNPEQKDTKKRILEESEKLFADKGFDNTGIDEIAKAVGIAKSVIYYHFKNKDSILKSIIANYSDAAFRNKKKSGEKFFSSGGTNYRELFQKGLMQLKDGERISKIILMESIKKEGSMPLFDLWEQNASFIGENWSDRLKSGVMDDPAKFIISTFFMFLMPLMSYQVFAEKLEENYNFTHKEIEESFLDTFTEYFETIILPKIWDLKKIKEKD